MQKILVTFGKAMLSQLHYRMLLLTVLPFIVSVAIWGVLLWLGLQPMIDWLHAYFTDSGGFRVAGDVLGWLGLGAISTVLVPLIAMWVLLPLMILTALVFVGVMAMPIIVRHVGTRHYPELEMKKGGSVLGSLWIATYSFLIFAVLWLVTLPLALFPPLTFVVQPALWGWLTYRVMAYDALSEHASAEEMKTVLRQHRWPLLVIGAITGAMGAAPTLLWLGGALSVIFFPVLAAGAIWLYVLVFVFTGLWFEHYCLDALRQYRAAPAVTSTTAVVPSASGLKDINPPPE
ncbi:EI24 domain-containing protein [Noviherbaspirillum malthae]|uniref:EI24 domain-containing protein n=1 Tax=Noviherbaspirillum malthae TaxID=1260987 RepID=UPI00188FBEE1|nr:EI24 domain-containing protein [Noviherbaspirillum malthae]